MPKLVLMVGNLLLTSDVARLGHTGAHALATRGCTTPVQICISADSIIVDYRSGAKSLQIKRRSIAMFIHRIMSLVCASLLYIRVTYIALQDSLRTDLGDCKIPKVSGRACPRTP